MKFTRVIRWTFIFLSLLSFLTLTTPLTFENIWFRNTVYLLVIVLSFIVAREVKNNFLRIVIKGAPFLVFAFLIFISFLSFSDWVTDGWKTVWISHRHLNHPNTYIAGQMLDVGGRGYADRVVMITPVAPLLNWVSPVDTNGIDQNWHRVHESFNPFNLKY